MLPNLPSLQLSDMFGSQSATVQASDAPTLAVTSSGVEGDFELGGGSNFQMEYWVKVNAPDNSPQIQVGVQGLLTANTSFNSADPSGALVAAASAQTQIDATDNTMVFSADAEDGTSSTVAVDTTFAQDTNVWFEVLIFASACDAINEGTASASAIVDPYFYIPSTVPNHQDYSIAVSDGILNSPPSGVPEPSTWTMMLAGGDVLSAFLAPAKGEPRSGGRGVAMNSTQRHLAPQISPNAVEFTLRLDACLGCPLLGKRVWRWSLPENAPAIVPCKRCRSSEITRPAGGPGTIVDDCKQSAISSISETRPCHRSPTFSLSRSFRWAWC